MAKKLLIGLCILALFYNNTCQPVLADDVIVNPSFENDFTGWSHGGELAQSISTNAAQDGLKSALLGDPDYLCYGTDVPVGSSWVKQTITVPTNAVSLAFGYRIFTQETEIGSDIFSFTVNGISVLSMDVVNDTGGGNGCASPPTVKDGNWKTGQIDISSYRGQTIEIALRLTTTDPYYNSWVYADNLGITVSAQPTLTPTLPQPSPTPTQPLPTSSPTQPQPTLTLTPTPTLTVSPTSTPIPTPKPADLNQDGIVDETDVAILWSNYNPLVTQPGNIADINKPSSDGYVNSLDYSELVKSWGQ